MDSSFKNIKNSPYYCVVCLPVRWWADQPAEKAEADWRWTGKVFWGLEGCPGQTGTFWEESCWCEWDAYFDWEDKTSKIQMFKHILQ